jgi:hypothetical protein
MSVQIFLLSKKKVREITMQTHNILSSIQKCRNQDRLNLSISMTYREVDYSSKLKGLKKLSIEKKKAPQSTLKPKQ